jgi:HSP20 family protein
MNRIILLRRPVSQSAMQRELEQLFRQQWDYPRASMVRHEEGMWRPQIDVFEVEDDYVVLVELAGMRNSEIEVTLTEGALMLSGRRPELHPEDTQRFHQLAINEGPFHAAVLLPGPVIDDAIMAQYDDGILKIMLPKRKPQSLRIQVTSE